MTHTEQIWAWVISHGIAADYMSTNTAHHALQLLINDAAAPVKHSPAGFNLIYEDKCLRIWGPRPDGVPGQVIVDAYRFGRWEPIHGFTAQQGASAAQCAEFLYDVVHEDVISNLFDAWADSPEFAALNSN